MPRAASRRNLGASGHLRVRRGDGVEEIFEAGDAFVIEPGHTSIMFAGCELVAFTSTEEAKQQSAVMMPNMVKYAAEHGIELPGLETSSESRARRVWTLGLHEDLIRAGTTA